MSSQNHCGLSIRLIGLTDDSLRSAFCFSHPTETLCRRSALLWIHILISFTVADSRIQVNTEKSHPSSCIIFSHNCLRLSKRGRIDWDGLGIWGGEEKLWIIFAVFPSLPTCKTTSILTPCVTFLLSLSVSDVELWILKDKVPPCPSTMSSKVNGEKEHFLGTINIVYLGHPD